jgi:tetratricopeptide (TPR) repeat protein
VSKRFPMLLLLVGLVSYSLLIAPFTSYMRSKPVEEKLGYVPSIKLFKSLSADQKELAGAGLVFKVMMYYGGLVGQAPQGSVLREQPDLQGMSRLLHGAVQLDPYNMDAYYFAQAILTWDAGQFKVANDLLEYGMKHRSWDWYLPFFAGFNYAHFLKDYSKAAKYYNQAGELSGEHLYKSLASRYLLESGETDLAIAYLTGMAKSAKNEVIRNTYQVRLQAYREVKRIELARDRFSAEQGRLPDTVDRLVHSGYLKPAPIDPYGGRFYFDPSGKVLTTSKFAFAPDKK